MSPILLLVDLQNDFLDDRAIVPNPLQIINTSKKLLDFFRKQALPIIHVHTEVTRNPDNRMPHWVAQNTWKCEVGTNGQIAPNELLPLSSERIIKKNTFDPFRHPELIEELKLLEVDTAVICGVHLHACVRATILGAFENHLEVVVAEDAIGSNDPIHAAITRRYFVDRSVKFIGAQNIMDNLNEGSDPWINSHVEDMSHQQPPPGHELSKIERIEIVRLLATHLSSSQEVLSQIITDEIGKPSSYCINEVRSSILLIESILEEFRSVDLHEKFDDYSVYYRPHGRVCVITPWNNPVYIPLGKIVPAILYGNSISWKCAVEAEHTSEMILQLLLKSGLPSSVVSLHKGDKNMSAKLMSDENINAVTLTGSLNAGHSAAEICSRRHIPLQAELGGNNASILWEVGSLEECCNSVMKGAYDMSGQRCTANRRLIVSEHIVENVLDILKASIDEIWGNDNNRFGLQLGLIVNNYHAQRIQDVLERSKVYCDFFYQPENTKSLREIPPALVMCRDHTKEIVQEETFGPVLVVQPAKSWNHAIALCNGVKQGLAGSIFTKSDRILNEFLTQAKAGILKVNQSTAGAHHEAPFGGWKSSSYGIPEHGFCDRDFYTRIQTVYN